MSQANWLLLVHGIPPKPLYLRAKVMRRLTQLGALPLKRSAYLMPADENTLEDLHWLLREIRAEGGDAWIVEGHFLGGATDEQIRENFRALRTTTYRALIAEARTLLERARESSGDSTIDAEWKRLRRRMQGERRLDFFGADGRDELEALMSTLDRLTQSTDRTPSPSRGREEFQARTWATRSGVKIDRMASAWLIRRFIDPAATFAFVGPDDRVPSDSVRFDMYDGEFTHEGNRCTFEVLADVAGRPSDPALLAIAQIVHDIDLREDEFQRAETAGVAALVDGIVARFSDDHRRIAEGASLFEGLYASLGRQTAEAERGE